MGVVGSWRATRSPTVEEARMVYGGKKTLGFGEFPESAYMGAMANNPKYAGYLANKGGEIL